MRKPNYDKFPATKVDGTIHKGWDAIIEQLKADIADSVSFIIAVDTYTGVHFNEIENALEQLNGNLLLIDVSILYRPEKEIIGLTERYITDDVLFGYRSSLTIEDYFDKEKVDHARKKISAHKGTVVVLGPGAAYVVPKPNKLIYIDMARWEIQQRFRAHSVKALGVDNSNEAVSLQYKRGYFNDWQVCDKHKQTLYSRVDYWIDTHTKNMAKMVDGKTFMAGLSAAACSPFRVVPFFDPAPWGGQWMKQVCDLPPEKPNYGWCFDCVPEENSLLLDVEGTLFEMPSINLVFTHPKELLGERVLERFGVEFPIRFDFLDTVNGGNLSLQVHPTNEYIKEKFGMDYTQDESYYLLDAEPGAEVYLGVKTGVDRALMIEDLRSAARGEQVFDAEKYVNRIPAKKHDHYLIPGGTIHCSGAEALVLEISSTPNLFTFKLWDWQRLGLDGKPRPINVEHGKNVIAWERNTEYVDKYLANVFSPISYGDGWREESTGLHPAEPIETRRHWFSKKVEHNTMGNLNVLNLVEGEEVVVESPTGKFAPFVVHYAETFIIPAEVGVYTITPSSGSFDKECATLKAYIR